MNGNSIQVKCPVCGMVKPKSQMSFTSLFLGKTYYLDTQNDKELFDAHPDYYVSKEERVLLIF